MLLINWPDLISFRRNHTLPWGLAASAFLSLCTKPPPRGSRSFTASAHYELLLACQRSDGVLGQHCPSLSRKGDVPNRFSFKVLPSPPATAVRLERCKGFPRWEWWLGPKSHFLSFFFLEQQGWSGVVGMFTAPYYHKVVGWLSMHFFIIIIIII